MSVLETAVELVRAATDRIAAALALHQACHDGDARSSTCAGYHPVLHRTRPVCLTCGDMHPCATRRALLGATTTTEDQTP